MLGDELGPVGIESWIEEMFDSGEIDAAILRIGMIPVYR